MHLRFIIYTCITIPFVFDIVDEKLVIRNMFKDPDEVVHILSDKYNILEKRVAESLLDASLNALAVSIHQFAFVISCDIPNADWSFS